MELGLEEAWAFLFSLEKSYLALGGSRAFPTHLQKQHKVVHGAVALVEVVFWGLLVLLIKLQLLNHIGMFQEPEQDLLREVQRLKRLHF